MSPIDSGSCIPATNPSTTTARMSKSPSTFHHHKTRRLRSRGRANNPTTHNTPTTTSPIPAGIANARGSLPPYISAPETPPNQQRAAGETPPAHPPTTPTPAASPHSSTASTAPQPTRPSAPTSKSPATTGHAASQEPRFSPTAAAATSHTKSSAPSQPPSPPTLFHVQHQYPQPSRSTIPAHDHPQPTPNTVVKPLPTAA